MNTIYIVEYVPGKPMGRRFAIDAKGVESIVREHYRKAVGKGYCGLNIDMENLIVTVTRRGHRQICHILRLPLDKPAQ